MKIKVSSGFRITKEGIEIQGCLQNMVKKCEIAFRYCNVNKFLPIIYAYHHCGCHFDFFFLTISFGHVCLNSYFLFLLQTASVKSKKMIKETGGKSIIVEWNITPSIAQQQYPSDKNYMPFSIRETQIINTCQV